MKNITANFNQRFRPYKALLIYRHEQQNDVSGSSQRKSNTEIYVESYDIGKHGQLINAHPLTIKEMAALSEILQATQEIKGGHLKSRGILPSKVLYIHQGANGFAVWYTPPQEVNLFFADSLNIPSGIAKIPAMVWKATETQLMVYAIKGKAKPTLQTSLCHAPFLNIYSGGNVCMGTVKIDIVRHTCLEDFITQWEQYFFNSYFSHSINGGSSTKTETKELWRSLMAAGKDFPQEELIKNNMNLKNLLT